LTRGIEDDALVILPDRPSLHDKIAQHAQSRGIPNRWDQIRGTETQAPQSRLTRVHIRDCPADQPLRAICIHAGNLTDEYMEVLLIA
jgi:hypothetical protein